MKDKLKSFFLNHGEKLGFGLIAFMALFVLYKTRWSPYSKTPQELVQDANAAKTVIANSNWPEDRRLELLSTKDINKRANDLRGGVDPAPYVFSTPVYTPIYPRSEPILPPKFLSPQFMIANADVVLIQTPPEGEEELIEGDDADGEGDPEDDIDSKIPEGLRKPSRPAAGEQNGLAFGPGDCGADSVSCGTDAIYGACGGEPAYSESDYMGGDSSETVALNGEGYRFVAVRGVIDWAAQKRAYAKALNLPLNEAARAEPIIKDFEIQRQQAMSEEDPWSGEWETLDIENSFDVLRKAYDTQADVVDVTVTNGVITEPLPFRVLGVWGSLATHPKITDFVLDPEEQKLEQMRIEKVRQAYEEMMKNQPQPLELGGFSKYQVDVRSMQNELSSSTGSAYMENYNNEYQEQMQGYYANSGANTPGNYPGAGPGAAAGQMNVLNSARSAASGRLMLFRYFDFDVDPGAVYRYRVRIEYVNPNFGQPIELLASPELAEGQTRTSDWSEPTPPVQVRPEAQYYLTGVEYESKVRSDVAVMDIYKWNAPTGTVVNEKGRYSVGDEIGGVLKTKVVNPLEETFDPQEIKVNTGDVVIDFRDQDDFKIDGNLPDLGKAPSGVRFDEVLVMNSHGNLRTYDRFTRESERVMAMRYQKFQDDIGEEYEESAALAASSDDPLGIYSECGDGGYGAGGAERPLSSASARRRARRRGQAPLRSNRSDGGGGSYGGGACN